MDLTNVFGKKSWVPNFTQIGAREGRKEVQIKLWVKPSQNKVGLQMRWARSQARSMIVGSS